jgi:hypothetical protein
MKNSFFAFILVLLMTGSAAIAQDCKMYFPDKIGTVRELTNYDKKGKTTGSVNQEIIVRDAAGSAVSVTVRSKTSDKDGKELSVNEMVINCKDGVFSFDMKDFIDKSMLAAYQGMEITMKGDNVAYPSGFKVGDKLADASINIIVKNNGMTLSNMTITVSNRTVAAQESITTPAGTWSCYKLSYDVTTKTRIMTINSKAAEWISEGVGMVKSESYDKAGKMLGYSLLTKLRN